MGHFSDSARLIRAGLSLGPVAWSFRRRDAAAPARLAIALERLGPAYIKLGQMLATRPDIVGADVALALEHLQDRLPPFADAAARAVIEQSVGRPVAELFQAL